MCLGVTRENVYAFGDDQETRIAEYTAGEEDSSMGSAAGDQGGYKKRERM